MSETPLSQTRYYTVAEAADILRVKEWSVRSHIKSKRLPATKPLGTWLIAETDLRALMADGTNQTADEAAS